jgi:hypothetical protein
LVGSEKEVGAKHVIFLDGKNILSKEKEKAPNFRRLSTLNMHSDLLNYKVMTI